MFHAGWAIGKCVLEQVKRTRIGVDVTVHTAKSWAPLACFEQHSQDVKVALMILNRPIDDVRAHLMVAWQRAAMRATIDGGTNRLVDCMSSDRTRYIPDIITGDFDSVRPEVLLFFKEKGCKIIKTPNQNYTDFTKGLKIIIDMLAQNELKVDSIVVFGGFGGRIDQTLANLNTLITATALTHLPVYLVGDESLACILQPGYHKIQVNTGLESDWCGLVPVGGECKNVKTTGLKWNLENQSMQFGGLISTSNTYAPGAEEVTVVTDQPVLWTMGIQTSLRKGNGSVKKS